MGIPLTNLLAERGDKVVVTSRSRRESKELVEYRLGDAKDTDFLINILRERWDAIVDFMIYSEDSFH